MKHSVYKLGRFQMLILSDDQQASTVWPALAVGTRPIKSPASFFKKLSSGHLLVTDSTTDISIDLQSLVRLLNVARDTGAGLVYSDYFDLVHGKLSAHPLNDCQAGSIRDDFNFGCLYILSAAAVQNAIRKFGAPPGDAPAAWYDLRLKISIHHDILHVPEFLYTAAAIKPNPAGKPAFKAEAQFNYVAKENFVRQKKMEKVATNYLKQIGAYMPRPAKTAGREPEDLQWKASIVIPVLNRKNTIADALKSALGQQTDFPFNILVVDNHSTDGTTGILKKFAAAFPHIHHIIPKRRDLGIGGCWNEAVFSPFCGRYAVQLDSDDLFSIPQALQKMVNALRKGRCAMVVGSYTLVNEKLRPIAPGLIDHSEWTARNGHNNLLRVNGMGAPRAFDAAILRKIGFPNVSYGEDYAVALQLTRKYPVGRIYESLYWCRRWSDNTDAGLSIEKQNRHDFYKDKLRTMEIAARQTANRQEPHLEQGVATPCSNQPEASPKVTNSEEKHLNAEIYADFPGKTTAPLPALCHRFFESQKKTWKMLASACRDLAATTVREIACENYFVILQHNPARAISGGAAVDAESISKRPCFLCTKNRPADQHAVLYRSACLILCNPAPIFDHHFTVVSLDHTPQEITSSMDSFLKIAADASPDYTVFYNGPACGASAPDHLHFQMIPSDALPFLNRLNSPPLLEVGDSVQAGKSKGFDRTMVVLESENQKTLTKQFTRLLRTARNVMKINDEPPVNVFGGRTQNGLRLTVLFRGKHRPDAYFAEGENRIFVSPGAIDMAGVIVIPLLRDFERLDQKTIRGIYREVSLDEETLERIWRKFKQKA